jgi:hypothetical protein
MISCEDFERHLLDLHQGKISKELADALEEHRRICKSCQELTPELIRIRQRLLTLVKLEPRPGFEMRLARRLQEELNPSGKRIRSLERSLAANWLAFGTGAVATVVIGFLLFAPQNTGPLPNAPTTAQNEPESVTQPVTHPELLTRGRESLPFGNLNDSTGEFHLIADEDSVPTNRIPGHEWQGQVVSQPK